MSFRLFALIFWLVVIAVLVGFYFFAPEVLYRLFYYTGPGGPFVNSPQG